MTTHLEESLQRDSEQIRFRLGQMAEFGGRMLQDGMQAFDHKDRQLCQVIILRDQRLDHMEKEVDRLCLEFLLRHQPAGAHLRFAYAALRLNFQLERVGDYAESIARQVLKLLDFNWQIPSALLRDISAASIAMLRNAATAFIREDPVLAGATAQVEEQVDALRNQVNSELMHLVQSNQLPLAALTPLMTIARRFERVSDQAKSICHETLYLCTGEYAKHQGSPIYHVLFVDQNHGCLARMAEAIGRGLDRAEFQFASAGLDPRPVDPKVAGLLEHLTGSPLDRQPHPLPAAALLADYQVVICFSPDVKRRLPPPARKAAQLEWTVPDPAASSLADASWDAAAEQAWSTLTRCITEFVSAVLVEDRTEIPRT